MGALPVFTQSPKHVFNVHHTVIHKFTNRNRKPSQRHCIEGQPHPVEHRTRITVVMKNGQKLSAETGGDEDDHSHELSDEKVMEKFREFTEDYLGAKRVHAVSLA